MQGAEAEHLRRVGLPDQAPVDGFRNSAVGANALQGIPGRHGEQAAYRIIRQFGQQQVEIEARQVRPRRVVDQHPVVGPRAMFGKAQQRTQHRVGALLSAIGADDPLVAGAGQRRPVGIIHRQADHQALQLRVVEEAVEAVFKDAATGQFEVLLGAVGAHAGTDAGGGNHRPEEGGIGVVHSAIW
ncbi:hypothetical protein D9M68_687210 [compost metagenome]